MVFNCQISLTIAMALCLKAFRGCMLCPKPFLWLLGDIEDHFLGNSTEATLLLYLRPGTGNGKPFRDGEEGGWFQPGVAASSRVR